MYIDNLTITALVVFFGAVVLFVNYCLVRVCGLVKERRDEETLRGGKNGS